MFINMLDRSINIVVVVVVAAVDERVAFDVVDIV